MAAVDDREAAGTDGESAERRRSVDYLNYVADAALFIDQCLSIDDTQGHGGGGGTMPFRLWPAQVGVVWSLMTERLAIVLKARQLGISWICCGYALWRCLFQPGQVVLLFSYRQDEADELLRRVRVMYERMPGWLRESCPLARAPNTSEMEWSNGSRIKSLPASRHSGSSWTASFVLMDEAAKILFADDLYAALKPTIDGGGQLAIVSTAFGIGNLFHGLWAKAAAGENAFRTIFLPWWARPDRDRGWYDRQVAEAIDPATVKQNYPASAAEAFLVSGRPRFDPAWIAAQDANVWAQGLPRQTLPPALRDVPGLTVYELPAPGRRYQVGADVAEGLEHGDYSDAVVIDAVSWVEMATIHVRQEPDAFARSLAALAGVYDCPVAVERNNHGHAVLATLKSIGWHWISPGLDDRPGWLTNVQTKPLMIDLLATALRDGLIVVRTRAALDELAIYRIEPDGKTNAPEGYNDDRVMSRAIAMAVVRRPEVDHSLGKAVPVPLDRRPPPGTHRDPESEWQRRDVRRSPGGPDPIAEAIDEADEVASAFSGMDRRRNFYGR